MPIQQAHQCVCIMVNVVYYGEFSMTAKMKRAKNREWKVRKDAEHSQSVNQFSA